MLLLPSAFAPFAVQVSFISCFSADVLLESCNGHFCHAILSFRNHNLSLCSIWGEMTELEGGEPMLNTPSHLMWHPTGLHVKVQICAGSMGKDIICHLAVRNDTTCMYFWKLSKIMRSQELEQIDCVFPLKNDKMISIYPGVSVGPVLAQREA